MDSNTDRISIYLSYVPLRLRGSFAEAAQEHGLFLAFSNLRLCSRTTRCQPPVTTLRSSLNDQRVRWRHRCRWKLNLLFLQCIRKQTSNENLPGVYPTTHNWLCRGFLYYVDGTLSFFGTPEGRVVKKGNAFELRIAQTLLNDGN